MAGFRFEPFPRQTLIGLAGGTASYASEPVDLRDFPDLAWSVELAAALPGSVSNPATVWIRTSMAKEGPFVDLLPSGESPSIGGTSEGAVPVSGRWLQVVVDVVQDETVVIAVRMVARREGA